MITRRNGEPPLAAAASWLVLGASFGLSASTWIALANLAGFKGTLPVFDVTLHQAWLLPIAVDGYVVAALVLWLSNVPAKVARFARTNTYVAALIGVGTQSAYHALSVWAETGLLWRTALSLVVGALPPGFAALAVHMRALRWRTAEEPRPALTPDPVAPVVEPVVMEVIPEPVVQPAPVPPSVPLPRPEPVPAPVHVVAPARPRVRGTAAARLAAGWSSPLART